MLQSVSTSTHPSSARIAAPSTKGVDAGRHAVVPRREQLRAADADRALAAQHLRTALDEGRLSLSEYDERLLKVYTSKTYGDLDAVLSDLPRSTADQHPQLEPAKETVDPTDVPGWEASDNRLRSVPRWLFGVWTAWLIAVSVNLAIWLLVSISNGDLSYFWPMWVAGPWGAVLLAATIPAVHLRRERQRRAERRSQRGDRRGQEWAP